MPLPFASLLATIPASTYIKAGALAAVAGIVLTMSCQVKSLRAERDSLKGAVDTAQAANKAQQDVIEGLQKQRERDAETVQRLMGDLARINEVDRARRRAIAELEKRNEDVRSYLSQPVPPALRGLLSEESGDEAGSPEGEAPVWTPPALSTPPVTRTRYDR